MRFGLVFSLAFHAVLIGLVIVTLPRFVPEFEMPDIVPIEVVDVADVTNVKAVAKAEPKPEPEPEPEPKPTPQPVPPPQPEPTPEPEPEPVPEVEPEPEPAPEPVPDPEPEPEPEKKPEPKPTPKPAPPKPTPPKPETPKKKEDTFDLDQIGVLIDKSRKDEEKEIRTAEAAPQETPDQKPRESIGAGDAETMSIAASLRRQIERCYSFPAGAVQPEALIVYVRIKLRPDGSLSEPPVIEDQSRLGDPYFRAAAEAAVRAVNQCAPYDLPADRYDLWKEGRLNFDPRRMLGM